MPPRVSLEPAGASERVAFVAAQVLEYAAQKTRAGQWPREDAPARARAQIEGLLGGDPAETGHQVRKIVDATGARVGWLWDGPAPPGASLPRSTRWLYQLTIEPEARRRGFARAALSRLEALLHAEGFARLHLNVFDWNAAARSLYATCGYAVEEASEGRRELSKALGASAPS